MRIKAQAAVLQDIMHVYSGKTIDNVLAQLKARIKNYETTMD